MEGNEGRGRARLRRGEEGFTLIEILVVVTIIAIFATVVAVNIVGEPEKARRVKAKTDIQTIESALGMFKMDNGFYPSTEQGLRGLIEKPSVGREPLNWREGGYLAKPQIPRDPWKSEYQYLNPGTMGGEYDLWSYGPDGIPGGEGEDADIGSWNLDES